jgi:uncharacterized protein involved in exopolysaccharide biosynthesis
LAQLEDQRRADLAASGRTAGTGLMSSNPVYQKIKISLSESEANVASLRARYGEMAGRLDTMRRSAAQMPKVEAEMAQLNRDYDVMRKNYEQLVQRRESASMAKNVDESTRLAEFRVIDPPRTSAAPVFPNRRTTIPLALVFALAVGTLVCYGWTQLYPTVLDAAALRTLSRRPVLGGVSLLALTGTRPALDLRFATAVGGLVLVYAAWLAVLAALHS